MLVRYSQTYNLRLVPFADMGSEQYLEDVDTFFENTFSYLMNRESPWTVYEIMYPSMMQLLDFYNNFLGGSKEQFYQNRVDSDINIEAAMCYITNKLVKKLSIEQNFTYLCEYFIPNTKSFTIFLKILKVSPSSLVSYCISGLKLFAKFSQHASTQWRYWFSDESIIFRIYDVESFECDLCDAVTSTAIRPVLLSIIHTSVNLDEILNELRNKTFLVSIFPGSSGMISHNLNLYIGCMNSTDNLLSKAVMLVIFIHELGHYLLQLTCSSFQDIKKQKRTPNSQESDQNRAEGGFELEKRVFGYQITRLSKNACYFLFHNKNYPNTIEEFQDRFKIENSIENGTVYWINRGSGLFSCRPNSYNCIS